MNDLRVGGLVSGLDTNAIIESMMKTAKAPIDRLNQQVNSLNFEKKVYNGIITSFNDIKSSLLPLKLESTFKNKTTTSSNESVGTTTATIDTSPGTYSLVVEQLAKNSMARSAYADIKIGNGAGITGGSLLEAYRNQLFGSHSVTVYEKSSGVIASDSFRANDNRDFTKYTSNAIDKAKVDVNGNYVVPAAPDNNLEVKVKVGSEEKVVSIDLAALKSTLPPATPATELTVQMIAAKLEKEINTKFGATTADSLQKVAVKVEIDKDGKYKFGFYDTTEAGNVSFEVKDGNIAQDLGFINVPVTPPVTPPDTPLPPQAFAVNKTSTKVISNQIFVKATAAGIDTPPSAAEVAEAYKTLATKVTNRDYGLIPNLTFGFDVAVGLKAGVYSVVYDDTMNKQVGSKSTFYGGTFDKITDANNNLLVPEPDVTKWLNKKMSDATDSYFPTVADSRANGFFHINGVKIDATADLTPNQLMAKINSSGAGVTASWNYEGHYFQIENNIEGTGDVVIGKDGDTSNILSMLKVTIPSGALYVRGSNAGTINLDAKIGEAGFSNAPSAGIFTINGVSVYLDSADTVRDLINKVNKSGANVTLSYDKTSDKFQMISKIGLGKIEVGSPNDTSNFLQSIGMIKDSTSVIVKQTIGDAGQKSKFTVDGMAYERDSNSINDVVNGLNISLVSKGSTTFTVKIDTERAIDAMAGFAAAYNKLMEQLTPAPITKDDREKYATALTTDTMKGMSEENIKDYNKNYERIKTYDTITHSSELRYVKTQIRSNLMGSVKNQSIYKSVLDMGFNIAGANTGAESYTITQLGFFIDQSTDKDALKKKITDSGVFSNLLQNNSEDIFKFFSENKEVKTGGTTGADGKVTGETTVQYKGFATKYDAFATASSNSSSVLFKKSGIGGSIDSQITRLQDQIELQSKRAESYLERMWAQFTAMETKMQRIQDQSAALAKITSGGGAA